MSDVVVAREELLPQNIQEQMIEQAQGVVIAAHQDNPQIDENRSLTIEQRILVSISDNVNVMAEAINKSEEQKQKTRGEYVKFFKILLICLIIFAGLLIAVDTAGLFEVKIEFLVSVIVAIVADVFAIVHTLVKYMTSVEHYNAYNQLIDSLLKHIHH